MAKRLYILHKLPTPYNDELFRALGVDSDIELQVFHLWRGSERRPWKIQMGMGYPNFYMQPKWGIDWHSLHLAWCDRNSLFMIGDWAHLPAIALLLARIIRRSPVTLWADTPQEHLKRPFWKRIPRTFFLRWLLSHVDVVFGTGRPARRVLIAMGAPTEKVVDLQFTVDLKRPLKVAQHFEATRRAKALRTSVGCGDAGVVFGMSGTIDLAKKAQDIGLQAFARCAAGVETPVGLLIAGTGKDLSQLQALAANLNIADRVNFLGWQESDGMDAFNIAIDVLLHPAHYDPFPLVIVEAMSWSKPIVGTGTSGAVEEKVEDGVNGFVVPPGNVQQMAAAMMRFVHDPSFLKSAGHAARAATEAWPIARGVCVVKGELSRLID